MATNVSMTLSKLEELVTTGTDARDQILLTANSLVGELQHILTYVNVTNLNPKITQLNNNMEQLIDLVVKNFDFLNEFFNNQINEYNKLGETLGEAATSANSSIG